MVHAETAVRAAHFMRTARSVCVSTGAGMSAESGVPTFRDAAGLWSNLNPEELATPQAFERDALKVWAWYRRRRGELAKVEPHDGHRVLAGWEARVAGIASLAEGVHPRGGRSFTVVTQNVDGLHHRAGSRNVIELHGRLDVARCVACAYQVRGLHDLGEDPHCPECEKRLRPGVVWFNEPLPQENFVRAFEAARECDVMLLIGTSAVVEPAASLVRTALEFGARLIEINPNPTPVSRRAAVRVESACGVALSAIDSAWGGNPG